MADDPDRHPILAADADRERSVALLREAMGEGRLTLDEFSDRVDLRQATIPGGTLHVLRRPARTSRLASGP